MEQNKPMACVGEDSKYGVAKNAYESTIRDLNRLIYDLYQIIEILVNDNNELSELRKSEYKSKS